MATSKSSKVAPRPPSPPLGIRPGTPGDEPEALLPNVLPDMDTDKRGERCRTFPEPHSKQHRRKSLFRSKSDNTMMESKGGGEEGNEDQEPEQKYDEDRSGTEADSQHHCSEEPLSFSNNDSNGAQEERKHRLRVPSDIQPPRPPNRPQSAKQGVSSDNPERYLKQLQTHTPVPTSNSFQKVLTEPNRPKQLAAVQATRKIMNSRTEPSITPPPDVASGSSRAGHVRPSVTSQSSGFRWGGPTMSERPADAPSHAPASSSNSDPFRRKLAEIGSDYERLQRDFNCAQSENRNLRQEIRLLRLSIAEREQAEQSMKDTVTSECSDFRDIPPMPSKDFNPKRHSSDGKDPDAKFGRVMSWGGVNPPRCFARNATDGHNVSAPSSPETPRRSSRMNRLFGGPRNSVTSNNITVGVTTVGGPPGVGGGRSNSPSRRSSKETLVTVVPAGQSHEDVGAAALSVGLPSTVEEHPDDAARIGASASSGSKANVRRQGSMNSHSSSTRQVVLEYGGHQSDAGEEEDDEDGEHKAATATPRRPSRRSSGSASVGPDGSGVQGRSMKKLFAGLTSLLPSGSKEAAPVDNTGTGSQETQDSKYGGGAGSTTTEDYIGKAKSVRVGRSVSLFPNYFSPERDEETAYPTDSYGHYSAHTGSTGTEFFPEHQGCGLMPIGRCRLSWDVLAVLCFLFELLVIPCHLAFVAELPECISFMLHFVTGFFFLDIALNFFTGYIDNTYMVMHQPWMARHYLRTWFFWDLLATVPFGLIQADYHLVRLVRILKFPRLLGAFRYFRVVQLLEARLTNYGPVSLEGEGWRVGSVLKYIAVISSALSAVAILAHLHGCVRWVILLRDRAALMAEGFNLSSVAYHAEGIIINGVDPSDGFGNSMRCYYANFWWCYTALTVGRSSTTANPLLWTFEVIVATERIVFVAMAGIWAVQKAMVYHESDARLQVLKDDTMEYLKQHKVSYKTRLQVLSSLEETRASTEVQRHFDELFEGFPEEVRRRVCEEMWSRKLLQLELIQQITDWNRGFIKELCLLVREEITASKSIVCHEGDASIAAYMVLRGELRIIVRMMPSEGIPNFTAGMWVGEKALVNPGLRRSATVVAVTITCLMAVPAEGFQELLSRFSLRRSFEELCEERLWKGLCGRCGSLGNHFSDACPKMAGFLSPSKRSRIFRDNPRSSVGLGEAEEDVVTVRASLRNNNKAAKPLPVLERTLTEFLKINSISRIGPLLQRLNITSLEALEETELHVLRSQEEITPEEEAALSPESFEDFHERIKSAGRGVLRKGALHRTQHLMFLSHYKVEAGTEAALMRSELEQLMSEDPCSLGRHFDVPVFLDSEDLTNLKTLQERVSASHNIVLLLTKDVFTRPWVLVEIVSAIRWCIPVLLVTVEKAGSKFEFPTDSFYEKLGAGKEMKKEDEAVLAECGITCEEVVNALKSVLKRIAVPYSPHKSGVIRRAELQALLEEVNLREEQVGGQESVKMSRSS